MWNELDVHPQFASRLRMLYQQPERQAERQENP